MVHPQDTICEEQEFLESLGVGEIKFEFSNILMFSMKAICVFLTIIGRRKVTGQNLTDGVVGLV